METKSTQTNERERIDWSGFVAMIGAARSIVVTTHIRPDGDALGSQIALGRALADLGKNVMLVNGQPTPPSLLFLDEEEQIRSLGSLDEAEKKALDEADLLVSVDTSAWAQLGEMADVFRKTKAKKLVIDHHAQADDIGAVRCVDPHAAAAGSLVLQAIDALGVAMAYRYAYPLFVAIATDTGWFRFSSAKPETYRTVARLMEFGVRPDDVYRVIYEQETLGRVRLVGAALVKTESYRDGQLMFTSLTLDDFDRTGALPSESEDIVNMTLAVRGAKMAVIMVEQRSGGYKLSFRSRCELDCGLLAAQFGGGGHKKAAGAFIDLPYDESKAKVLAAMGAAD